MNIAIVDDDVRFSEKVERFARQFYQKKGENIEVSQYTKGLVLIQDMDEKKHFDIYMLDVEMPQINGFDLAKKIQAKQPKARIIFITSHEKYALRSIKIGSYYFILKEEYDYELKRILERIYQEEIENGQYYTIQTDTHYERFCMSGILHITKQDKYAIFHCMDNKEYYERISLEKIYQKLPQDCFIFVNRQVIIHMKHVIRLEQNKITMQDKTVIPISRRMSVEVKDNLAEFWGRK